MSLKRIAKTRIGKLAVAVALALPLSMAVGSPASANPFGIGVDPDCNKEYNHVQYAGAYYISAIYNNDTIRVATRTYTWSYSVRMYIYQYIPYGGSGWRYQASYTYRCTKYI